MSRAQDIEKIGDLGEEIVQKVLSNAGYVCSRSKDKYDQDKDIIAVLNDQKYHVQVKTEFPFLNLNAFTVDLNHSNQLPGCLSADMLFFVEVPELGIDNINVWYCSDRRYSTTTNRDGREAAVFRLSQMELYKTIYAPKLAQRLNELCPTDPYYKEGHYRNGKNKRKSSKRMYRPSK